MHAQGHGERQEEMSAVCVGIFLAIGLPKASMERFSRGRSGKVEGTLSGE